MINPCNKDCRKRDWPDCRHGCPERQAWLEFIEPRQKEERRQQMLNSYVCRAVHMAKNRRGPRRSHRP